MTEQKILPLVAIVGPTASGKSTLGVWLAQKLGGDVIACDSTQLYRGFDIGTAKPSMEERQGVTHHLLDVLDVVEEATAGGYRERATAVLDELRENRRLPILTVGTGLYLRVFARRPGRCSAAFRTITRTIAFEGGRGKARSFAPDSAAA